jgi:hypothetical protein
MTMFRTAPIHPGRHAALVVLLILGALAVSAQGSLAAKSDDDDAAVRSEDFHWSGHVARGKTLEVVGVNGRIEAVPTTGADVDVSAEKSSRRDDPKLVRIEVSEEGGDVLIKAVYPRHNGGRWGIGSEHCDVTVDFKVQVPAGVRFVARTVNGAIEAERLEGPTEAHTVNGSIHLGSSDAAEAETVNGSIRASVGVATWSGALEFKTVNGGITLDLPAALAASLEAETLNGQIDSDFPLTVQGSISRHRVHGTIGSAKGAGTLSLSTVNGTIRLRTSN